jgi:hypothetical protein
MAKQRGESKQGLIITLVFFILLALGLGVATYFGFADQDKKDKEVKEAQAKEKTFKDERDWWRFQANLYRAYMLPEQKIDMQELAIDKDAFDKGSKYASQKEKAEVDNVIKALESRVRWDPRDKATWEDLVAKEKARYEALAKAAKQQENERDKLKKSWENAETRLKDAQAAFDKALVDLDSKAKQTLSDERAQIDKLKNELDRLGTAKAEGDKKADEKVKLAEAETKKKDKMVKQQQELLTQRNEEIAATKLKGSDAPRDWRTDWRVVRLDNRGNAYINLGSADKVKPQLTFSIHGLGGDGRPQPQAKGTMEVMSVLGEHLSQARMTSVKDPNRDPIVVGDILFNPSWNPNTKKHVAIAGRIDLSGDGRDSLVEFIRNLERQNIVVDAYIDTKDLTVKGSGVSVKTDYLIVGEGLEYSPGGFSRDKEYGQKLEKIIAEMKEKAAQNGVTVIDLGKYLDLIGYRVPRSALEKPPGYSR